MGEGGQRTPYQEGNETMTPTQAEIAERQRRLHRLLKGEKFTYYRSDEPRFKYNKVFETARKLSNMGHVQINQRRNDKGIMEYMATGLLTENRKVKAREGEYYDKEGEA